jgi:hypothetical protein
VDQLGHRRGEGAERGHRIGDGVPIDVLYAERTRVRQVNTFRGCGV